MGDFRMPSLGADMVTGTLVEWRVHPGDTVRRGDIVAVVDTDKAAIEVEVWESGVVDQILVSEGTRVPVGTVVGSEPERIERFRTALTGTSSSHTYATVIRPSSTSASGIRTPRSPSWVIPPFSTVSSRRFRRR